MKKFFTVMLVGALLFALSGMVSGATMKVEEMPEGASIRLVMPVEFIKSPVEKNQNGAYVYSFYDRTSKIRVFIMKFPFSDIEIMRYGSGTYPLDGFSNSEKEKFLDLKSKFLKEGEFLKLPSDHWVIAGDVSRNQYSGKALLIMTGGFDIRIMVEKSGGLNPEEAKLAEKILKSLEF